MKLGIVLAVMIVLMAVPTFAQTHPCDVPPVQNPNLTSPVKVTFCHPFNKDTGGNPITVTAFNVYLDSTAAPPVFVGPMTPIGSANATGLFYFESPTIAVLRGAHVFFVSATLAGGSETARSAAIPFGAISDPVAAPSNGGVKK